MTRQFVKAEKITPSALDRVYASKYITHAFGKDISKEFKVDKYGRSHSKNF